MNQIVVDESLIKDVQLRSTGANVHKLNNYLLVYKTNIFTINRALLSTHALKTKDLEGIRQIRHDLDVITEILEVYVMTGDLYSPEDKPKYGGAPICLMCSKEIDGLQAHRRKKCIQCRRTYALKYPLKNENRRATNRVYKDGKHRSGASKRAAQA